MQRRQLFDLRAAGNTDKARAAARARARSIPNVPVTSHDGVHHRFYDDLIRGRIVMINFMYADCEGICPTQTANLRATQKILGARVGREIFMYSLTLKPKDDPPEKLAHYVSMHGIGPGWRFLTGTPQDLESLRQALGFTDPDEERDRDTANHIGNVLIGVEPLDRWAGCPGNAAPELIAHNVLSLFEPARRLTPDVS